MNLNTFLAKLKQNPSSISFNEAIEAIEGHYVFTPTMFKNGSITNSTGENNGSCKIIAFGLLNKLTEQQTLACFGDYYRKDVLEHPENDDHQNIRNFIANGWDGIAFEGNALSPKN